MKATINTETRVLRPEVNHEQYLQRMRDNAEKGDLTSWIPQDARVLDFGCADGTLAPSFAPHTYTGYDLSAQMVEAASLRHPNHTFTTTLPDDGKWDAIVFSSVLHEVYAYQGYSLDAVRQTIVSMCSHLTSGGSFYVRDGFQPYAGSEASQSASYRLTDPADAHLFLQRLNDETALSYDGLSVDEDSGMLVGRRDRIADFLNVYTWGWGSFEREKHERVNFLSHQQWLSLFNQCGMMIVRDETITQSDYFTHLSTKVDLRGDVWPTKVYLQAIAL